MPRSPYNLDMADSPHQTPPASVSPFGAKTQRYWDIRHSLFSRFDSGVKIDEEGLFSAKPEAIALHIARLLPGSTVLDAFCGVGGSAIGFARAGKRVLAVDTNAERIDMARHNAKLYGVEAQIDFVVGDCRALLESGSFDSVYLDPQWGGPDYYSLTSFTLAHFAPNGLELLNAAFSRTGNVAITIPKNFEWREFGLIDRSVFVERNMLGDRLLFRTAYFGVRMSNDERQARPGE